MQKGDQSRSDDRSLLSPFQGSSHFGLKPSVETLGYFLSCPYGHSNKVTHYDRLSPPTR
jgi:hypothetical protein